MDNKYLNDVFNKVFSVKSSKLHYCINQVLQDSRNEDILDTFLLKSSYCERLDIIKVIYEEFNHPFMGKEECFPNCAGETPLLLAAHRGNLEIVKYLLEHKANPFAVDSHGCNAAMNAVASGNVELAKFLIEDCQIAWQGYTWEGTSALQFAIASKSPQMFGYILSIGGLKYNHPKYGGEEGVDDYPILRSANFNYKSKSPKWSKILSGRFKQILHNYQTNDCSPLCHAAEQGDLKQVKELIQSYEYPLVTDKLICSACKGGNIEIFHYFINELRFPIPENAIAYAVCGANEKLVSELIYERQQNVFQTNSNAETLLHIAVKNGNWRSDMDIFQTLAIIQTDLLNWGKLDPNAISYNGSVLDLACKRGNMDIIRLLVKYGAVIDSDTIDIANYSGNTEIAEFLQQQQSNSTKK